MDEPKRERVLKGITRAAIGAALELESHESEASAEVVSSTIAAAFLELAEDDPAVVNLAATLLPRVRKEISDPIIL